MSKPQITPQQEKLFNQRLDRYSKEMNHFDTNPFGSCQYSSAFQSFDFVSDCIEILGYSAFKKVFGIRHGSVTPVKDLLAILVKELKEYAEKYLKDDPDMGEYYEGEIEGINKIDSLDSYFQHCKDQSQDLWSAYISHELFLENFGMKSKLFASNMGVGPILNQLVQSENKIMGFSLALMDHHYQVDMDSYSDMDT